MPVLRRTHVTDIADVTSVAVEDGTAGRKRKGSGLDAMLLPELKQLAGSLGIRGAGTMRKGQLIAAIQAAQSGSPGSSAPGSAVNGAFTGDSGGADRPVIPTASESSAEAHQPVLPPEAARLADGVSTPTAGLELRQGPERTADTRTDDGQESGEPRPAAGRAGDEWGDGDNAPVADRQPPRGERASCGPCRPGRARLRPQSARSTPGVSGWASPGHDPAGIARPGQPIIAGPKPRRSRAARPADARRSTSGRT